MLMAVPIEIKQMKKVKSKKRQDKIIIKHNFLKP